MIQPPRASARLCALARTAAIAAGVLGAVAGVMAVAVLMPHASLLLSPAICIAVCTMVMVRMPGTFQAIDKIVIGAIALVSVAVATVVDATIVLDRDSSTFAWNFVGTGTTLLVMMACIATSVLLALPLLHLYQGQLAACSVRVRGRIQPSIE